MRVNLIPLAKLVFLCAMTCAFSSTHGAEAQVPKPPMQPLSGPGGRDYSHAEVTAELRGRGAQAYWIFEPAKPSPERAPVIVFNHGWSAIKPQIYQAWIDHLVERGNIVIYPLYQENLRTPVKDFTPNAIAAVKDALRVLQTEKGHVKPLLDHFAVVGHSMGGVISANMAALWKESGLPQPDAVMCVEPGKTWGKTTQSVVTLEDLSKIPAGTLLLTVVGDDDKIVRDIDAKRIFNESIHVSLANKDYITLVSDDHGEPALKAGHLAPVAWAKAPGAPVMETAPPSSSGPLRTALRQHVEQHTEQQRSDNELPDFNVNPGKSVDALDFYGTWKLFDGLIDAAFRGKNKNYALGNTPEERFMGTWSDGVAVKELIVTDHP